uniref:Uncharacterized protein n=1 Tax=Timema shepardi TaxID=629360 RepID=A0A7R9B3P2_TIMSH|nr:unnamed protein product [Timema shepardi]
MVAGESTKPPVLLGNSAAIFTKLRSQHTHSNYSSPMASLVLTDSSQLTADGFEKRSKSLVLVRSMTQYLESRQSLVLGWLRLYSARTQRICPQHGAAHIDDRDTCFHDRPHALLVLSLYSGRAQHPCLTTEENAITSYDNFVYEGLPYLSQSQESQLRHELCEGHLFQDLERTVTLDDERVLQEECSRVCDWVASAVLGDSILLGGENLQHRGKSLVYMLHKELRKRFLSVWTFPEKELVLVKKVSADERNDFVGLERESSSLEHDVIKSMLGFSRVFKLLTELGKPLVGHNLLLDLALMYAQFHEPLPSGQILKEHFMKQVGTLTVLIYLPKPLQDAFVVEAPRQHTSLVAPINQSKELVLDVCICRHPPPPVDHGRPEPSPLVDTCCQGTQAFNGRDLSLLLEAFFYLLVAPARITLSSSSRSNCHSRFQDIPNSLPCYSPVNAEPRPLSSTEHLAAVSKMKNSINIVRANISHICLDGPDPKSNRPRLLHIRAKGSKVIDLSEKGGDVQGHPKERAPGLKGCHADVTELFDQFGAVDAKLFNKQRALVAVGNYRMSTAEELLKHFLDDISPLPRSKLIQVTLDGSNEYIKSATDHEVCSLLNLGTYGLHVVHGFLRTGLESVDWDISSLLLHMHYLFTNSPACQALFTQLTGAREALHKFKDHKDLEVKLYSTLYHSPVARTLLWGGLTLSAVSCVAALVMFLRRVS